MRKISPKGLDLIKKFEGFSATTYLCPAGYPTIGYGHLIKEGECFPDPINESQGLELLASDVSQAERAVDRFIDVPLNQSQLDALISFTFNLGGGALQKSTLRRKINLQEHEQVPPEFLRWVWAGKRKLPGLIKRRQAEADMYKGI
ncbi:MAG: lysozyme [Pseudomonadota bacterium]